MKYTIMGFSQKRAVELGLSVEDLAILRWFVDFYSTDHMRKFQADGKEYVLVSYQHFLEDMPIFTCTKKTLAAKFKHLVDAGVLEYELIKDCGTFSVYRIGQAYESLICKHTEDGKNDTPLPENKQPGYPKIGNPVTEKSVTKDPSTIYPSTSNKNIPQPPNSKTKAEDIFFGHDFSDRLKAKLRDWLAYKAEKRDSYKPTGLKSFMTVISNKLKVYSEADILSLIDDCMANNWQGIIWDRLKGKENDLGQEDNWEGIPKL